MNLDVFSDPVCPWCWIGKRRLAQALETPGLESVTVTWRAFQLYPEIPAEGMARDDFMQARFGTRTPPKEMGERIRQEAARAGLDLELGRMRRMPNTLDAHRLARWAHVHGGSDGQASLVEALFRRHFEGGDDLGDRDVLAAAAADASLDAEAARSWLDTDEGRSEVLHEVRWSRENGITGVPCFVLPNGFCVPGAQEPATLARFIAKGLEKLA